jgi:hypothetical protein
MEPYTFLRASLQLIFCPLDVSNFEITTLKEDSPADDDGNLAGLNPDQVMVVCLNNEFFSLEVRSCSKKML